MLNQCHFKKMKIHVSMSINDSHLTFHTEFNFSDEFDISNYKIQIRNHAIKLINEKFPKMFERRKRLEVYYFDKSGEEIKIIDIFSGNG